MEYYAIPRLQKQETHKWLGMVGLCQESNFEKVREKILLEMVGLKSPRRSKNRGEEEKPQSSWDQFDPLETLTETLAPRLLKAFFRAPVGKKEAQAQARDTAKDLIGLMLSGERTPYEVVGLAKEINRNLRAKEMTQLWTQLSLAGSLFVNPHGQKIDPNPERWENSLLTRSLKPKIETLEDSFLNRGRSHKFQPARPHLAQSTLNDPNWEEIITNLPKEYLAGARELLGSDKSLIRRREITQGLLWPDQMHLEHESSRLNAILDIMRARPTGREKSFQRLFQKLEQSPNSSLSDWQKLSPEPQMVKSKLSISQILIQPNLLPPSPKEAKQIQKAETFLASPLKSLESIRPNIVWEADKICAKIEKIYQRYLSSNTHPYAKEVSKNLGKALATQWERISPKLDPRLEKSPLIIQGLIDLDQERGNPREGLFKKWVLNLEKRSFKSKTYRKLFTENNALKALEILYNEDPNHQEIPNVLELLNIDISRQELTNMNKSLAIRQALEKRIISKNITTPSLTTPTISPPITSTTKLKPSKGLTTQLIENGLENKPLPPETEFGDKKNTLLHLCAWYRSEEEFSLSVEKTKTVGLNINKPNKNNSTAAFYCRDKNKAHILIKEKFDLLWNEQKSAVNKKDQENPRNPISTAAHTTWSILSPEGTRQRRLKKGGIRHKNHDYKSQSDISM